MSTRGCKWRFYSVIVARRVTFYFTIIIQSALHFEQTVISTNHHLETEKTFSDLVYVAVLWKTFRDPTKPVVITRWNKPPTLSVFLNLNLVMTKTTALGPRPRPKNRAGTVWRQWCSPRDQGFGLEAPRGQKWKSWSWSWIMKSWSWSWKFGLGLEEKVLQFFKTFVVILDGSEQVHHDILWETTKTVLSFGSHCLREPSALHAHQPQLRRYLINNGAIC